MNVQSSLYKYDAGCIGNVHLENTLVLVDT